MTAKKARQLLVGTIVTWNGDRNDMGTIRAFSASGFCVDWANGQRMWFDYRAAERIEVR